MRAVLLAIGLSGCGFTGAGSPRIDASADGTSVVDVPMSVDAPPARDAASDAVLDAPAARSCGAAYVTVANSGTASTYRKVNTLTTWPTAKATCAAETAHLVIPETLAEGSAVFAFVDPASNSPYYWAGIEDPNDDDAWTTVLDQPFASPPFQGGQPTDGNDESYILVGANGRFYDWHDYGTQEYACECAP